MLDGVPNFALTIGYTNASWTLKADLVAGYICRLLKYLDRQRLQWVMPKAPADVANGELTSLIDLKAGYILRDADRLPRQGTGSPWRLHQNYCARLRPAEGRQADGPRSFRAARAAGDGAWRGNPGACRDPLDLPGTGYLDVAGTRLRYRKTGTGDPVLLLHGIGQSLEDWNEQHERLSARHAVYSVDLPGFAYSDRLRGRRRLAKLADALPAVLDALGVHEPLPVIGNSLGGAVAMKLAADHPGPRLGPGSGRQRRFRPGGCAGLAPAHGQAARCVAHASGQGSFTPHRPVALLRQGAGDRRPR